MVSGGAISIGGDRVFHVYTSDVLSRELRALINIQVCGAHFSSGSLLAGSVGVGDMTKILYHDMTHFVSR